VLRTAPKRPYIPIIVYAGQNVQEYLERGVAAVAEMVLRCPVCGTRLEGNGWRKRVAKERSKGGEREPPTVPVHQLICPLCRAEGRHPWNFRVLPSVFYPFKHFVQQVRLAVFDLAWQEQQPALAIEAATGVDRWLVRLWLARALDVLAAALPLLAAAVRDFDGDLPAVAEAAGLWQRWWALGLALREAMARLDPQLALTPGSVLEWVTVVGARRQRWWAP
jgi:hypothetical protein